MQPPNLVYLSVGVDRNYSNQPDIECFDNKNSALVHAVCKNRDQILEIVKTCSVLINVGMEKWELSEVMLLDPSDYDGVFMLEEYLKLTHKFVAPDHPRSSGKLHYMIYSVVEKTVKKGKNVV